jgi:murein L,D-transpeptidase YafK
VLVSFFALFGVQRDRPAFVLGAWALLLVLTLCLIQPETAWAKKQSEPTAQTQTRDKKPNKKRKKKRKAVLEQAAPAAGKSKNTSAGVSDVELVGIYKAISLGQSASALGQAEALLLKAPNYKLLHLLRADLLLILSQRQTLKTSAGTSYALPALNATHQLRIKELQQEAWLRLNSQANHLKASRGDVVPKQLLKLADNEPFALVVDSKYSRLYVYQNMGIAAPRLVTDFYITQGLQGAFKLKEGDNRTPIGAYFISGPISQKLPDLYGYGALNMDYPNAWDKRKGRTGYGIWVHGTPSDTYARAPYASNGCVVLANPDMESVFKLANNGAMPIVVVDKLEWVEESALDKLRKPMVDALEQWRSAQEKGDLKALAQLYSANFTPYDTDKKTTAVSASKIMVSNLSAIEYPGETDMVLMRFDVSSPQTATVRKQLYWKKESKLWKIVLENTL